MAYVYNPKPYVYRVKPIPGGRNTELVNFRLQGDVKAQAARLTKAFRKLGGKGGLVYATNQSSVKWLQQQAVSNLNEKIKAHGRPNNFRSGALARVIRNENSHVVSTVGFRFMVEKNVRKQIPYAFSLEYGDRSQIGRDIYFLFLGRSPSKSRPSTNRSQSQNAKDRADAAQAFNNRSDNAERFRHSHRPSLTRSTHPYFGVQHHTEASGARAGTVSDRLIGPREFNTGGKGGGAFRSGYIKKGKRFQVRIKNPVPQYRYGRDAGKKFVENDVYRTLLQARFDKGPEQAAGVVMVPGLAAAKKSRKGSSRSRSKNPNATRKFPVTTTKI